MQMHSSIIEKLKQNDPTLTELNWSNQQLTDLDIQQLSEALIDNTHLTTLNVVSYNEIGAAGAGKHCTVTRP
jgi:hypothetical protein